MIHELDHRQGVRVAALIQPLKQISRGPSGVAQQIAIVSSLARAGFAPLAAT
jgi:hypothetical protein